MNSDAGRRAAAVEGNLHQPRDQIAGRLGLKQAQKLHWRKRKIDPRRHAQVSGEITYRAGPGSIRRGMRFGINRRRRGIAKWTRRDRLRARHLNASALMPGHENVQPKRLKDQDRDAQPTISHPGKLSTRLGKGKNWQS